MNAKEEGEFGFLFIILNLREHFQNKFLGTDSLHVRRVGTPHPNWSMLSITLCT